jgi:hypothetical protein
MSAADEQQRSKQEHADKGAPTMALGTDRESRTAGG